MSDEIKLCKDCALFIHPNAVCGASIKAQDYVNGTSPTYWTAQAERESRIETDCGPQAKFFKPIIPANDYAEAMIRRDQRDRLEGGASDFGVSACGRSDRSGS